MEGFGVKKIMETLKRHDLNVTQVVHDKDASTMRQVMDVYQDAEEGLCLCKLQSSLILQLMVART